MRTGLAIALVCALASCGNTKNPDSPERTAQITAVDASLLPTAPPEARADAGPPLPREPDNLAPDMVAFAGDGTLVAAGGRTLLARAKDGTIKRAAVATGSQIHVTSEVPGVAVETDGTIQLLATPSLKELFKGKATSLFSAPSVIAPENARAVLLQRGDALLRLALPAAHPDARVDNVIVVAGGKRINVSLAIDDSDVSKIGAYLYDAEKGGNPLGRGLPLMSIPITAPRGAHAGDAGFIIDGSRVLRIDLKTTNVVKQASVRCPKDNFLGNPTPSPGGDLLLVTCGYAEGVVLDGATLAERRRIPKIMPGCDNGENLGGVILADGKTLYLEGCGGSARLNVSTGTYSCADDSGLLGAPYMMTAPMPGVPSPGPQLPKGREHVPRCAPVDAPQTSALGHTSTWRLEHAEHLSVKSSAKTIDLEADANYPVIAPDETALAYTIGTKVVIRELPTGKEIATLTLSAP
jgi:hypothetical protein